MTLVILDTKSGNIGSVKNAIEFLDIKTIVSNKKKDIDEATHIILPGVGSYSNFINNLNENDLIDTIIDNVKNKSKPFLGICVGMQVLSSFGYENDEKEGLDFIPGTVSQIDTNLKLPHIGWNKIKIIRSDTLFKDMQNDPFFYFLHSYSFKVKYHEHEIANSFYGSEFSAIVKRDNIYGVQFHPEKSQKSGLKLLSNFYRYIK